MSKLKAGVIVTPHNEGMSFSRDSDHVSVTEGETEFYLKSEVDKVIAKLNGRIREEREAKVNFKISACDLIGGLRDAYGEIRNHKFKRCLTNAENCNNRGWYYFATHREAKARKMWKWRQRWLGIAKTFQPQ